MPTTVLSLADAKQQLNIATATTTQDTEIQAFCDAAAAVVERHVGAIDSRTVTETLSTITAETLILSTVPLLTVTSIVSIYASGPSWVTADLVVDTAGGVLRRLDRGVFFGGPFVATYTAGRASVPQAINIAARMIVQSLWETQRGGAKRPSQAVDELNTVPAYGYELPARAIALLEPFRTPGGFA